MGCPSVGTALQVCPIFPQSLRSWARCVRRTTGEACYRATVAGRRGGISGFEPPCHARIGSDAGKGDAANSSTRLFLPAGLS